MAELEKARALLALPTKAAFVAYPWTPRAAKNKLDDNMVVAIFMTLDVVRKESFRKVWMALVSVCV